jgi:hypothetical protein
MNKDDREGVGHKVNKDNIRLADTIIKMLTDNAESPQEACTALMLAHAKLWVLYGDTDSNGIASMMAEYVTDFFTLTQAMERPVPPINTELLN